MKYKDLDAENVQDERNYSNYKISFVLGTIGATWALKVSQQSLTAPLVLALIFAVTYIAFEIFRMFCSVTHNQTVLDRACEEYKSKNITTPLNDEEISGSLFGSNWGKTSYFFYIIDHFLLIFTFIAFIFGAIPSL